jgi:hypothetical protein
MRSRATAGALAAALAVTLVTFSTVAGADSTALRDPAKETNALKRQPELDIVRIAAGHSGGQLRHKVRMRGRLKPDRKATRPFILLNTKGGPRSGYEYLVSGRRVLKRVGLNEFRRVGTASFRTRKRTWIFSFPASAFGPGKRYGWAALTNRGRASDVAPNRRYAVHELGG